MNKQGFTLIEILITLSLVGFLTGSLFVGFENYTQRSLDLKGRSSVTNFINRTQNYINFENWKDNPDKNLIFTLSSSEFSLKTSDNIQIFENNGFEYFDLAQDSMQITFTSKSSCQIRVLGNNENLESKNLMLKNKLGQKALEIYSDQKNCYLEILKI